MDRIVSAMKRLQDGEATVDGKTPQETRAPLAAEILQPGSKDRLATHLSANHVISLDRDDGTLDAYRMLRTQVLNRMRANQHTTLAIAAPLPGDGASHIAANLAMAIVMDPQNSVLLVDCDFKRPRLHELFCVPNHPGVSEYFTRGSPLTQLLAYPSVERLTILPAGTALPNAPELLGSPQMMQLIKALKSQDPRRFIIFDLPAILHSANAVALAPLVDATLMVVAERQTQADHAVQAAEMLAGTNFLGTVLNKASSNGLTQRR